MKSDTVRMIVGFGLIVVILIGWQILFKPKPRAVAQRPVATQPVVVPDTTKPAPVETTKTPSIPALVALESTPASETLVTLENDLVKLEFSNIGGTLAAAHLKKFSADVVIKGAPLLGTVLLMPDGPKSLAATPMKVVADDTMVTFTYTAGAVGITKSYTLGKNYTLKHRIAITGAEAGLAIDGMAGLATTEKNHKEALTYYSVSIHGAKKLHGVAASKLKKPIGDVDPADWVVSRSKYFMLAVIGQDSTFDSTYIARLDDGRIGFTAVARRPLPVRDFTLYLGPIEHNGLRAVGCGLEAIAGRGWNRPIELAMLWLLRLFHTLFGNWGVAILVFSIVMKAALWPLTRTQTKQMRQMQLLQPKLNELKTKFKDSPEKLNAETMQLYKLYKINPLSGCLPMVVQLPIFWALYAVLRSAIEMRGAHFVFWLKDLSQPDMLFGYLPQAIPMIGGYAIGLLPVLMGVSFIAQNLMTSTDKKNWAMTIIFPIFITAIFLNLPSGLQLYWFMYNILSVGESLIAMKGGTLWRKKKNSITPAMN